MSETFGARLRRLRIAAGLTQPELARRSGESQSNISRMELDQMKRPSIPTTAALASALGVSFEVLGGTEAEGVSHAPRPTLTVVAEPAPLEDAVWREIDPTKHTRAEADAAQRLSVESRNYLQPGADVADLARRIVAATHALHKEGLPLTSVGIWTRVQSAGSLGVEEARTASNARTNAAADADLEEKGIDAEHRGRAAAAVQKRLADNATKGRRG